MANDGRTRRGRAGNVRPRGGWLVEIYGGSVENKNLEFFFLEYGWWSPV